MTAVADNIVSDYGLTSVDGDVEKAIDKAIKDAVAKELKVERWAHNECIESAVNGAIKYEREACAKVAEDRAIHIQKSNIGSPLSNATRHKVNALLKLAIAIKKREDATN